MILQTQKTAACSYFTLVHDSIQNVFGFNDFKQKKIIKGAYKKTILTAVFQ